MNKKTHVELKKITLGCFLGTTIGLSLIGLNEISRGETHLGKAMSLTSIIDQDDYMKPDDEISKKLYKLNYTRSCLLDMQRYLEKKNSVLSNYKKCETLDDILTRQQELESVGLTDDDKIYKDCPMSAELQHFIYEQSITNNKPFDFLMSIVYAETRGLFNSSGVAAYNVSSNTYDLGYTQQNTKASLPLFQAKYNLTYEEAYELLLNNDYANVCAAFIVVDEINQRHTEYDPYEYAGCYNGWLGWRNYSVSQDYVFNHFSKAYDEVFTEHHYVEIEKYAIINSQTDIKVASKK